jgi:hypothetical protein
MIVKNTIFVAMAADESSKRSQRNGQKKPKLETYRTSYKILNPDQLHGDNLGILH